jgi:hypothetical protein
MIQKNLMPLSGSMDLYGIVDIANWDERFVKT